MKGTLVFRFALVFVMLLPATTTLAQLPSFITGTTTINQMDYLASTDLATTPISPTFANLADVHDLNFVLNQDGCVKIEVSFVLDTLSVGQFELRAVYDDSPDVTVPSKVKIGPALPSGYHTFTFFVQSGAGYHHIDVQVRGRSAGSIVTENRSLVVLHN